MNTLKKLSLAVLFSVTASTAYADLDFHPLPFMTTPEAAKDLDFHHSPSQGVPKVEPEVEIHRITDFISFPRMTEPEESQRGVWETSGLGADLIKLADDWDDTVVWPMPFNKPSEPIKLASDWDETFIWPMPFNKPSADKS